MFQSLKKWTVRILVTVTVLVAALYFPVKWGMEWRAKDAYYHEVSGYVHRTEPVVARLVYQMAARKGCLLPEERVELQTRLDSIHAAEKEISFVLVPNLDKDRYSKVIDSTLDAIRSHCARVVTERTGLDRNNPDDRDEFYRLVKLEFEPFEDFDQMDRVLNTLTWNYAGVLWEKTFSEAAPYTMKKLAEDRAEYEALKPKLDEIIAKYTK
jgi:hypothetical protein